MRNFPSPMSFFHSYLCNLLPLRRQFDEQVTSNLSLIDIIQSSISGTLAASKASIIVSIQTSKFIPHFRRTSISPIKTSAAHFCRCSAAWKPPISPMCGSKISYQVCLGQLMCVLDETTMCNHREPTGTLGHHQHHRRKAPLSLSPILFLPKLATLPPSIINPPSDLKFSLHPLPPSQAVHHHKPPPAPAYPHVTAIKS